MYKIREIGAIIARWSPIGTVIAFDCDNAYRSNNLYDIFRIKKGGDAYEAHRLNWLRA